MKRQYVILLSVVLIAMVAVGVYIMLAPPEDQAEPITNLEWGVQIGDSYQYKIRTFGATYGGLYSTTDILQLNGSIINATITALPSLETITDLSFPVQVIQFSKMNCTFANGTSLSPLMELIVCEGLSGCTLPIGNWSAIAELYADTALGSGSEPEQYGTYLEDEYLTLYYMWFGDYDDNGGWWGDSLFSSGAPLNALWFYEHQGQTIYIEMNPLD